MTDGYEDSYYDYVAPADGNCCPVCGADEGYSQTAKTDECTKCGHSEGYW